MAFIALIINGIAHNKAWLLFGVAVAYFNEIQKYVLSVVQSHSEKLMDIVLHHADVIILVGLCSSLVCLIAASVIFNLISYANLELRDLGRKYQRSCGWPNPSTITVSKEKVVDVRVEQNFIDQYFERYNLCYETVESNAGGETVNHHRTLMIPGLDSEKLQRLISRHFPKMTDLEEIEYTPISSHYKTTWIYKVYLPVIFLSGVVTSLLSGAWWAGILFLPLWGVVSLMTCMEYRRYGIARIDERHIVIRGGILGKTYTILNTKDVQSIFIRQTAKQRSLAVAALVVHMPSRTLEIPYCPYPKVSEIISGKFKSC